MSNRDAQLAARIAQSVLDGSVPVFLGCKQLVGPLSRLGVHMQEPFVAITAVDSETDDKPIWPQERAMWNPQRLAEEDARLAVWLPRIQDQVLEACHAVVERFGTRG